MQHIRPLIGKEVSSQTGDQPPETMAGAPANLEDLPYDALMIKDLLATMVRVLPCTGSRYTRCRNASLAFCTHTCKGA